MRSRLWLVVPVALLCAADAGLTLAGQSAAYWAGDYAAAVEANPFARPFLVQSPWLFIGLAAAWLVVVAAIVLAWRHPLAVWLAVLVAAAHAVGGASWLTRGSPWQLVAAGVYLAVAAQGWAWCWHRSSA
jgi:hypothetical protein